MQACRLLPEPSRFSSEHATSAAREKATPQSRYKRQTHERLRRVTSVAVDTGPLVAFFDRSSSDHDGVVEQFKSLTTHNGHALMPAVFAPCPSGGFSIFGFAL
jgi:hypothetical protein